MKKILLLVVCSFTFFACQKQQQKTIILSKSSLNYINWIEGDNIIILDAYTIKNTDSILALADGIILTGGEDINPLEYNDTINLAVCGDINYQRDTLERKLFDFALKNKIGTTVIHRNNGEVMHEIVLCDTSSLIFPSGTDTIMVNSWHHQGLKIMPNHLRVIARSFDGLPEAVVMDKSEHPFMIAVQFHPERLGKDNAIHQKMRDSFYNAMGK